MATATSPRGLERDEYLTVAEVAAILKVSPKRVRNLMSSRVFRRGDHFLRRQGIGPRFLRSRIDAWLQNGPGSQAEIVPMARGTTRFVEPPSSPA